MQNGSEPVGIPFNEIMKNHKNWHNDADFDIMSENYRTLKPIMHLFYFGEKPKHPQIFSLLFSEKGFAQKIIDAAGRLNMREVKHIWLMEYSEEERDELIRKGFYQLIPNLFGCTAVCFMTNTDRDELFINIVL